MALVLVVACGGGSSEPPPPTGVTGGTPTAGFGDDGGTPLPIPGPSQAPPVPSSPPTVAQACAAYATAACNVLQQTPDVFALDYPDLASCTTSWGEACAFEHDVVDASWTPEARNRCASAIAGGVDPGALLFTSGPFACHDPAGKRPDDAPCIASAQCASRACKRSGTETCGVCGAKGARETACVDSSMCEDGLLCGDGKCRDVSATMAIGTPCTTLTACGYLRWCKGGYYWSQADNDWRIVNGTCQPFGPAKVGETCGSFFGPTDTEPVQIIDRKRCQSGGYCNADQDVANGHCLALPGEGQPCQNTVGCAGALVCAGAACRKNGPDLCQ